MISLIFPKLKPEKWIWNRLNAIFGEKYAKIRDDTFDVMMKNPDVFKHPDTEDLTFEEERKAAAVMTLLFHKLRPLQEK